MPSAQTRQAQTPIAELGERFFDPVDPARFPSCIPRFLNRRAAATVGLQDWTDEDWATHLCAFAPLPGNLPRPLALRYHGHQFRIYNPDLGDGRGFLFAQLRDKQGRLLDLGTKGSGQTPWSRTADGRLTLKGAVREILATEMLEALGVNTSRTFAIFETGEALVRGDEPSPTRSAVLTRLSHGHIRIGTFQRHAFHRDVDALDALTRYCLEHLYGERTGGDTGANALRLCGLVGDSTATLAASYMAAGFVHGVLNSDNINVTGESFDYGPWRFTPYWDPDFTAAYFDHQGLYAFGRQPEAIHWDLAQFAGCLALIAPIEALTERLSAWGERFEAAMIRALIERLGIAPASTDEDRPIASAIVAALEARSATIDRVFFHWRGGRDPGAERYPAEPFRLLADALRGRERQPVHSYWQDPEPCSMHIEEVESIWARIAEADDWSPLDDKVAAIRRMGEAMQEHRAAT